MFLVMAYILLYYTIGYESAVNFWEILFLLKGRKSIFLPASRSRFVAIGHAKILKIGQWKTFLCQKRILNRDFASAGEIIHRINFNFMQHS